MRLLLPSLLLLMMMMMMSVLQSKEMQHELLQSNHDHLTVKSRSYFSTQVPQRSSTPAGRVSPGGREGVGQTQETILRQECLRSFAVAVRSPRVLQYGGLFFLIFSILDPRLSRGVDVDVDDGLVVCL